MQLSSLCAVASGPLLILQPMAAPDTLSIDLFGGARVSERPIGERFFPYRKQHGHYVQRPTPDEGFASAEDAIRVLVCCPLSFEGLLKCYAHRVGGTVLVAQLLYHPFCRCGPVHSASVLGPN